MSLWPWVEIEAFRGIEKLRIEPLARQNLIVGTNNVGKTSVLEAIELLNTRVVTKSIDQLHRRGVEESSLMDDEARARRLVHSGATMAVLGSPFFQVEIHREPFEMKTGEGRIRGSWRVKPAVRREGILPEPRGRSVAFVSTNLPDEEELRDAIEAHLLGPRERLMVEIAQRLDPEIARFSATKVQLRDGSIRPITALGEGVRRILMLGLGFAESEGGLLLVDEIDTGLHHALLSDVWRIVVDTARKLDVQVFATTHSWDCVEAFAALAEEAPDEVAMHRLEPGRESSVHYYAEKIVAAARNRIEVR